MTKLLFSITDHDRTEKEQGCLLNMDKEQTQNKKLSTQTTDSITQVDFRLDEPRKSCSFKGNRKLWNTFVSYSKLNYGSVCHVLEPIMIAILESKVNLSHTIKPLHIENLNIERAVKRVRRYAVEEEEEVSKEFCFYCLKSRRRAAAVGLFKYDRTGEVYALCSHHANDLLESGVWSHV